jgi:hypothetical protein
LLRVSIVIRPPGTELVEVFFKDEEDCFPESRAVMLSGGGACSEAPSPVSSTNLDEFHNVKNLDASSPAKPFHTQHLAVLLDMTYQNFY